MELNVFDTDAFSGMNMIAAVNKIPHRPRQLGALGLFGVDSVDTTLVWLEVNNGRLILVPETARGGAGTAFSLDRRDAHSESSG